jgi:2-dehydropantoate 2-reductase
LPLRDQLLDRKYRLVLAALQREALDAMRAAGIKPAAADAVAASTSAGVLRLPTWLFRLLARRMLLIDDKARSSMADDLAMGRPTEVDAFCGAVVRLAAAYGMQAPINARMNLLLSADKPTPMTGHQLRRALGV